MVSSKKYLIKHESISPSFKNNNKIPAFTFPKQVPLPEWDLVTTGAVRSQLVKAPDYIQGEYVAGQYYNYSHQNLSLEIEIQMRYIVHTNGNLKGLIKTYTGKLATVLYEAKNIGAYSMFANNGRAYLTACINPRGGSTVTADMFKRNRYLYDLNLRGISGWLRGKKTLWDNRCLWAHLSIPFNNSPSKDTYLILEKTWYDWYRWWSANFPD